MLQASGKLVLRKWTSTKKGSVASVPSRREEGKKMCWGLAWHTLVDHEEDFTFYLIGSHEGF